MNASTALVSYLANAVWEVTVIAAAGWLASRLLRRLGARAEHVVWVSTLVVAIFTPAVPLLGSLLSVLEGSASPSGHTSIAMIAMEGDASGRRGILALPESAIWLILAFYLGSLLFFAARLARSLYRTNLLLRGAGPLRLTPQQEELWNRCQALFAADKARILQSEEISGPVVLGWRRPVLLLPEEFAARCAPEDFLAALAHECAHAKRQDFWKNLAYEAVSLVLAFHPAIWAIKSRIAQTREIVCDSMVTELVLESRTYAHSLLRLAAMVGNSSQTVAAQAIGIFDADILEKRIMTMKLNMRRSGLALKCGLILPAMLLLLSVAAGAASLAVAIEPQSPSQAAAGAGSPYGPLYKIGNGVSPPVPLNSVEAEFPKSGKSLKKGFNAIVLVGAVVDEQGMPQDVHVVRSYKPDFDAQALKAVRRYRFKPAMRAGNPVAVAITIEVNFKKY